MRRKLSCLLFLLLAFETAAMFAQSTNAGDIRGTVSDKTGAVIPGATVSVLNVDTGVSKDYVTNNDGLFDTSSIVAGSYKLTFTKQGFETYVRGPITLEVGFTTVNAAMTIGSTTQQVIVTTDVPLLKTESGDQTATLESRDMSQMPNVGGANGPDWENFMILLPVRQAHRAATRALPIPVKLCRLTATCHFQTYSPMAHPQRCQAAERQSGCL